MRNGLGAAHFFLEFWIRVRQVEGAVSLGELLEQTVPAMGYELVDWDMSARSRLVRVFIDKPKASTSRTARGCRIT